MSANPSPRPRVHWRPRPMLRADVGAVADVEQRIYPFPWSVGNFADSLEAGYEAWVFESDGELVGYAILMYAPDEAHLLNLGVARAFQGQGVGRSLLEWLCAGATAQGARAMLLEVRPSNSRALALYLSAGFERVGLRRNYYPSFAGKREDAMVLARVLGDG